MMSSADYVRTWTEGLSAARWVLQYATDILLAAGGCRIVLLVMARRGRG